VQAANKSPRGWIHGPAHFPRAIRTARAQGTSVRFAGEMPIYAEIHAISWLGGSGTHNALPASRANIPRRAAANDFQNRETLAPLSMTNAPLPDPTLDATFEEDTSELEFELENEASVEQPASERGALHRLRQVRRSQGLSLRSIAKRTGLTVSKLRAQEQADDLKLSDLHLWQEALEVPLTELLEEPGMELSVCIQQRAQLVRLMKTAAAIKEAEEGSSVQTLADTLIEGLIGIMPELKHISAWHSVGQRRTLDEMGRIMTQTFSVGVLAQ
jgi:transcriptional regulator with XRE-family HTH domain